MFQVLRGSCVMVLPEMVSYSPDGSPLELFRKSASMRQHKPETGVPQQSLCPPQPGQVLDGQRGGMVMGSIHSSRSSEG